MFEIPITRHPKLPEEVPLVADFHDMRNRLSYYLPLLREADGVRVPVTKFFPIEGDYDSYPEIEYRDITAFMQDQQMRSAFVRGDYSSAKYGGDDGSRIDSHDPWDIETVVLEMIRQLGRSKRHLGGRIAVREWIPHEVEVRYFIRDGKILYGDSVEGFVPDEPIGQYAAADALDTYSWSCDFIKHKRTNKWYCIDCGLDGLYYNGGEWVSISEHLDKSMSPEQFKNEMPPAETLNY